MKSTVAPPEPDRSKVAQSMLIDRGFPGKRSHFKTHPSKRRMVIAAFMVAAVAASSIQLILLQERQDAGPPSIPARITIEPHLPIIISDDNEFILGNGVRSGDGSPGNPYVISDWEISSALNIGISITSTSKYFVIRNVTVDSTSPGNDGIRLDGVSHGKIYNVTIANCSNGIVMWSGCSKIEIGSSSVSSSTGNGIVAEFGASSYINITGNRVAACAGEGIKLNGCTLFNIISNNVSTDETSSSSRKALVLQASSNGMVTGNNLTAVYNNALYCPGSSNIIVAGNRMSSVYAPTITLTSSSGFLIYGNNFMGVYPQAYDDNGEENSWNSSYPTGGNYWVDYIGIDVNGGPFQNDGKPDGIGDTSYTIDSNSVDYYPKMISGPVEPIPEFPTLVLPILSIVALLFAAVRRPGKND